MKYDLTEHGFDLPIGEKKDIFDSLIENMKNPYILNIDDLMILCNVTQEKVIQIFNNKFIDIITHQIAKNNINLKLRQVGKLDDNQDAGSIKLLLQLTTNSDEYKRISNQWEFTVIETGDSFILPRRKNG